MRGFRTVYDAGAAGRERVDVESSRALPTRSFCSETRLVLLRDGKAESLAERQAYIIDLWRQRTICGFQHPRKSLPWPSSRSRQCANTPAAAPEPRPEQNYERCARRVRTGLEYEHLRGQKGLVACNR